MIRRVVKEDIPAVNAIYNQAITAGFCTADTVEKDLKYTEEWFAEHCIDYTPAFVFVEKEEVVGWVSLSEYRKGRQALRHTLEISYYIRNDYQGRGVGTMLMMHAIEYAQLAGVKTLIAILLDKNMLSIALLKKFGFEQWAYLPNIANFNGVECSHLYYGLRINK